jgi:hypothetical protein
MLTVVHSICTCIGTVTLLHGVAAPEHPKELHKAHGYTADVGSAAPIHLLHRMYAVQNSSRALSVSYLCACWRWLMNDLLSICCCTIFLTAVTERHTLPLLSYTQCFVRTTEQPEHVDACATSGLYSPQRSTECTQVGPSRQL